MNQLFNLLLLIVSIVTYGQSSIASNSPLKFYEVLYKKGASLKKSAIGHVSPAAYMIAHATDSVHPLQYFDRAEELLQSSVLNDAAFLYYLGKLRYSYLDGNRPNVGDQQFNGNIKAYTYRIGEPIGLYLEANLENYIMILQKVLQYYEGNDSDFFPRDHYPESYQDMARKFDEEITELKMNKKKYSRQFAKERQAMKKLIRGK